MATYAIGDIQGCAKTFLALLETLKFKPKKDKLWLAGDLVNRGPGSLMVLRHVYGIKESVRLVLGNHDLHLLAVASGAGTLRADDTIHDILNAPDRHDLLRWLRHQPVFFKNGNHAMVHAGLLPTWSFKTATALSSELETLLQSDSYSELLANMRGSKPKNWSETLTGWKRYRVLLNAFTRMRVCDKNSGDMDFSYKGPYETIPESCKAWFELPTKRSSRITLICGHWSALGIHLKANIVSLDSGCIWGGPLTAYCLDTREITQVPNQDK